MRRWAGINSEASCSAIQGIFQFADKFGKDEILSKRKCSMNKRMICRRCNSILAPGNYYCPRCGERGIEVDREEEKTSRSSANYRAQRTEPREYQMDDGGNARRASCSDSPEMGSPDGPDGPEASCPDAGSSDSPEAISPDDPEAGVQIRRSFCLEL